MIIEKARRSERNGDYDDYLLEIYGWIEIGPSRFHPADIIYEFEPVTYRCGWADYDDWRNEE